MHWFCILFIALIFPISLKIKLTFVKGQYFNIKVYIFKVKILNVFVEFKLTKLILLFRNKTILIDYIKILPIRNKVKGLIDVEVVEYKNCLIYSTMDIESLFKSIFILNCFNNVLNEIGRIAIIKRKDECYILKYDNYLKDIFSIKVFFNIITIFELVIKLIIGKIVK